MKGKMEISMNQANMVEAVQLWIDQHWTAPAPEVVEVKEAEGSNQSYVNVSNSFTIELNCDQPAAEEEGA